jgi:hypothetical protein
MLTRNRTDNAPRGEIMSCNRPKLGNLIGKKRTLYQKNLQGHCWFSSMYAVDKARPYRLNLPLHLIEVSSSGN